MSHQAINIGIIGVNGFGAVHLKQVRALAEAGAVKLVAVSDLRIDEEKQAELQAEGAVLYSDYKAMLAEERSMQLVIVSTPIHLHAGMGIDVMEAGYDLLLEKPPAATIEDLDRLIDTMERTGKRCAVNFSSFTHKMRQAMADWVAAGKLGEVTAVKGLGLWKRAASYYNRTPWAGKLSVNGRLVLDGTVMNPFSHLLNLLVQSSVICGAAQRGVSDSTDSGPTQVQAELYHGNTIEGDDTSCIRVMVEGGPTVSFYATLCSRDGTDTPLMLIEGTAGSIRCEYNKKLELTTAAGETVVVETEDVWPYSSNLMNMIRVLRGEESELICPLRATRRFMLTANGAFESAGAVRNVASEHLVKHVNDSGDTSTWIVDIEATLREAFESCKLLSEFGTPWAEPTSPFSLEGYRRFQAEKFAIAGQPN
ncbi:Gfo/Idh/MocA family protein [Paenibacillus koleovorans]|uniref:Gfo/Idh/MocA family protein n=1 Tax=Paenibacillus koleovorans TaxID=121608 RepID=UPI0013E35C36|nr:Gfo/Idh/MocA family oxidoreductase [Paenibacillus koleovorans]